MGAAIAAMVPSALVVVLTFREAGKIIGESFMFIVKPLVPAFAGSVVMMIAIWGWQEAAGGMAPVVRLAVSVLLGTGVYVGYLWLTRRELFYEVRDLVGRK